MNEWIVVYDDNKNEIVKRKFVRCKDCFYAKPFNKVWVYPLKDTLVCTYFIGDEEVDDNFFCGCAIKKIDKVKKDE